MATRPAWAASAPRERTLADHAYEAIHQAIVTGALGPGERLRIEELAANLDLSFSPLREALQRLEAVGLVQIIPHRGARVTELSLDDLRDIWEARRHRPPSPAVTSASSGKQIGGRILPRPGRRTPIFTSPSTGSAARPGCCA